MIFTQAGITSCRRCRLAASQRGGVIKHLLFPLAVAIALLSLVWMLALPGLLAQRLEKTTGLILTTDRMMANPLTGQVRLTEAVMGHAHGAPTAPFISIKRLETTVRPWTVNQRPLPLPLVVLDLDTLAVVIGPDGRPGTGQIDTALATFSQSSQSPFHIKRLELSVSRVMITDYSRGLPSRTAEYQVTYRRAFTDVTRLEPVLNDVLASVR